MGKRLSLFSRIARAIFTRPKRKAGKDGDAIMKEETIHYLLRLLKRNPSEDPRHEDALRDLAQVQDSLLNNYRDGGLFKIQQPQAVHLMIEKQVGRVAKAVSS